METPNKPLSLSELEKMRQPIRNTHQVHKDTLNPLERFAMWITDKVGTMGFFLLIFLWTVVWLFWNTFAPESARFDPYPAFVLWLFISNMIQILLLPLIMVGQNLQTRYSEVRAQHEYEVSIKSEREISTIIHHLEQQQSKLDEVLRKLEK